MTTKLVFNLETTMFRAMQEKQYSAVVSNAKVLMKLICLNIKINIRACAFGALGGRFESCLPYS